MAGSRRNTSGARVEIETRRLILRPLESGDLAEIAALFASPEVCGHLAVDEMTLDAARDFAAEFICDSRGEFRSAGTGALAVTTCASPRAIGYCGLRPVSIEPGSLELMYALTPDHWGHGLATEAARACVDWGYRRLDPNAVIALARAENLASHRVLEKLGLRYIAMTDRYYRDRLRLYRLSRNTWRVRSAAGDGADAD